MLKPRNGHVLCSVVLSLRICLFLEDISPTSVARIFVMQHNDGGKQPRAQPGVINQISHAMAV